MCRSFRAASLVLAAWMISGFGAAFGQSGVPVLVSVNPPGATVGTTADWAITGRNLGRVQALSISGRGVKVASFEPRGDTAATARIAVEPDAEPGFREIRLDGPGGLSNLALIRVDRLPQGPEVEPNDQAGQAQVVGAGAVVTGVLKALDLDHYRIEGAPGLRLTIDLEARRLGTAISPVLTWFDGSGRSIAQAREAAGGDRDCRLTVTLPPEGWCVVQVRDNTYGGGDQARYRLRVDPSPYATGLFPLGGRKGQPVEVEFSGGNLLRPIRKVVRLPDEACGLFEVDPATGPFGPIASPARLIVGDGPEATEPSSLTPGVTANGRISRVGEVDTYRLAVKGGQRVRVKVEAAALGSWLDSVASVLDESGTTLAENDDATEAVRPAAARSVSGLGVPEGSPDSSLEFEAKADGQVSVVVTDRCGDGGPEYGYRLVAGEVRPDFAVTLLLGGVNANAGALNNLGAARNARSTPGQFGVFNLKPGGSTPINFLVAPEGRPGPVTVRVEGLPNGVTAEPVAVRFPGPAAPGQPPAAPSTPAAVADFLMLKVASFAQPGLSEFRVVATAEPTPGSKLAREASATIGIDSALAGPRPITRVVARFPLRILGEARPLFVGPPAPPTLRKLTVPGPLLIGDRIDLALDFDRSISVDDGSILEAQAEGVGLFTNTVVSAGTSLTDDDESNPEAVVRVIASPKAKPGPYVIRVTYAPPGGSKSVHQATVDVRAPIAVEAAAGDILLKPGDSATFAVKIRREPGFDGEVELKLEGLPRGVKLAKAATIAAGSTSADLAIEMASSAKPLAKASEIRVVGMARTPGSSVAVESRIRPMIRPRASDN